MLCFVYGSAYLSTQKATVLSGRGLCEIDPNQPLLVTPFDGSPTYVTKLSQADCIALDGYNLVVLPPSPHVLPAPRKILASHQVEGARFLVVFDGFTTLSACTPNATHCFLLPNDLRSIAMRYGGDVFALTASHPTGKYVFVARFSGGGADVLIDTLCMGVEQRDAKTFVLTPASPCGTLGTVTVYDSAFSPIDSYPVKTGGRTTDDKALLAFEYAKGEDEQGLAEVTTAELFSSLALRDFASFFAPYKRILPLSVHGDDVYVLVDESNFGTLFRFTQKDGLIDDVSEFATPLVFLEHVDVL